MVLNKRDLEKAFSPNKHRKLGGQRRSLNKMHKGGNAESQTPSNMRVVIRIRPQNAKEMETNTRSLVQVVDETQLIFDPKEESEPFFFHGSRQNCRDLQKKQNKHMEFGFDRVFRCDSSNEAVFEGSTKDIVKSLLDGYNCSVFAYGATGAGKTFTMLGSKTSPGITYLTIVELYKQMEALVSEKEFDLGVSHLEVYNENVQDLIQPSGPLHLREDGSYGVRIPGLSVHRITSADELFILMAQGNKNRTQHPTDANAESSRSHSVFQLYVRMTNKLNRNMKIMKLSMIDLAGSERGSATGCKGMRFTEGANINKSLLALGNCINSLADGLKHIPYRDSKLTRLLKDSLGGNCQTVMIANVSPSSNSFEDTYNTLKYATRAKKIKQMIKKNIVSVQLNVANYAKMVESLTAENENLKRQLRDYEAESQSQKSASTSIAPPVVLPNQKEKLSAPYQELEAMNKELLKLSKEIKLLKWRNHVKQKIADRLPHLSVDNVQLDKRLNRIRTSMKQLEGRETSFKQKLKESYLKRNEHFERTNSLIKQLDQDGTDTNLKEHITMLHLQLELQEKNMQLEHCQQLLSMQQNELESEDMIVKELCRTLKEYYFILQGHNIRTDSMISHYGKLVHKLEGFKHISWKRDQETDYVFNFTFSIAQLSGQSSEGIVKAKTPESPSENKIIPESVVGYAGQSSSCSSMFPAEKELSEIESRVGDIGQCGDACSDTTLKVLLSANETATASDGSHTVNSRDESYTLEATNEDDNHFPVSQTSLPENAKVLEMQRVKGENVECCRTLKEINVPVECMDNIVAQCSLMPLTKGCDFTVPNNLNNQSSLLNNTFVLPEPSHIPENTLRTLVGKNNSRPKMQSTVTGTGSTKKNIKPLCNKENRVAVKKLKPSPSYQGSRCKVDKDKPFAVPEVPQFRTSKPPTHKQIPISKHIKIPVTTQELGKAAYMKHRSQLNRAHPYVTN